MVSVPYWPATSSLPLASNEVSDPPGPVMAVMCAPAPAMSVPVAPLTVPEPVIKLPVAGPKSLPARCSESSRALTSLPAEPVWEASSYRINPHLRPVAPAIWPALECPRAWSTTDLSINR